MSFFGAFSQKVTSKSVALFDIGPDSVAGGYATVGPGVPTLLYGRRVPLEVREGETALIALDRALISLGGLMLREGGPLLLRATGSGHPGRVIASMATPWQQTIIRSEEILSPKSFVFSRKQINEALAKRPPLAPGFLLAEESIIGTRLNGYDTNAPLGKTAHRAVVTILTSIVDERAAEIAGRELRRLYHTHASLFTSFAATAERGFRALFPPEQEFIVVAKRASIIDLLLVRHGILAATGSILEYHAIADLAAGLTALSRAHPLPYTIFLLAEESDLASLESAFADRVLTALWLSANPPRTIPIAPAHFTSLVKSTDPQEHDAILRLLVLAYAVRAA